MTWYYFWYLLGKLNVENVFSASDFIFNFIALGLCFWLTFMRDFSLVHSRTTLILSRQEFITITVWIFMGFCTYEWGFQNGFFLWPAPFKLYLGDAANALICCRRRWEAELLLLIDCSLLKIIGRMMRIAEWMMPWILDQLLQAK